LNQLVTGDAVALELWPAKLPSRGLAVLIDLVLALGIYAAVTLTLVALTSSLDDAAQAAIVVGVFVLLLVGGPIAVETLTHGRSLGKLACGLRVVRDDGGPIRFRHALVRGAVGAVEILLTLGTVACAASLASQRGRRVGDVLAGTLVVRERVPTGRAGALPAPPPWLAGRFSSTELSGVPEELWLAIRQYLSRMRQLDPQVGWSMAVRLAEDLVACTGEPAPPGVPPAEFLAAVVHERQTRDAWRAFGGGGVGSGSPVGVDLGGPVRAARGGSAEVRGAGGGVVSGAVAGGFGVVPGAGPGEDLGEGSGSGAWARSSRAEGGVTAEATSGDVPPDGGVPRTGFVPPA
jgi:uncharacterized RDD family membrane protein YckC